MKKSLLIIILFALLFIPSISADYSFGVEVQETHLWIKQDGSCEIWYYIVFKNNDSGSLIDIVDIGLPNDSYDLSTATATIDGYPAVAIRKSSYIPIGVEIHLSSKGIPAGKKGELRFKIIQKDMIYVDDNDENYASVEFATNYFGSRFVSGKSEIDVFFHFPPGVTKDEPRFHKDQFTEAGIDKNKIAFYRWFIKEGDISLTYKFGASFPKKYVDANAIKKETFFSRIGLFFSNIFGHMEIGSLVTPCLTPCIFPWGIIIFFIVLGIVSSRKRRFQYFKPELSARGVGIKRGLTAVEAAILLERPFDKVIAMIVFGLLRKGYIKVKSEKPFAIEKIDLKDATYHKYEKDLLESLNSEGIPERLKVKDAMVSLVKDVQAAMKGFNLYQTRKYYEEIVDTAWKHVKNADLDTSIDWVMVDKDFDRKFERSLPSDRTIIMPDWYGTYHRGYYGTPYHTHTGYGGGGVGGSGGAGKATLSLKQFANNVANGFENVSHNVVSSSEEFTASVTTVTNPVPVSTSSGGSSKGGWSSGGGHSSCACACACAGCACACAGGGR